MSSQLNSIRKTHSNYNIIYCPNLFPEHSTSHEKLNEEIINGLIRQNEEKNLTNIDLLPKPSLEGKEITKRNIGIKWRALRLIEEKNYAEAADLFSNYFIFRTTDPIDSLFDEKCIDDIVKKLMGQNAYDDATNLLKFFNKPWRKHTNIFNNGFFEIVKILLRKHEWLKVKELLELIPEITEKNLRSNTTFLIVKKLMVDDSIKFNMIEKTIKLIDNEHLKQQCFDQIIDKIIKTLDKFAFKLNQSEPPPINDSIENDDPLSQLPPEILLGIFDFFDEKTFANLYLGNRHMKKWIEKYYEREIKISKLFLNLVIDYCKLTNNNSILGSIYDLVNSRGFLKLRHRLLNEPGYQINLIDNSKKLNLFNLKYKIANLFKNADLFFDFNYFLQNQVNHISKEEKKSFAKICALIDFCISIKALKTHWSKTSIKDDYLIEFGKIKIFFQYESLNIFENLHYLYYLLTRHPRYHHPLLIYFIIHSLLQKKQLEKAKKLAKLLPRYEVKISPEKTSDLSNSQPSNNSKIRRQIAEIALFEIFMAEKKFDKACKIVKKITENENEYLLIDAEYDSQNNTSTEAYNKEIYKLFINKLLEFNLYELPIQLMRSDHVESWFIKDKIYDILLTTKASIKEIERITAFFSNDPSKNKLICDKAIELINEEQIQKGMQFIRQNVKLNLNECDFNSTASLSEVIEHLLAKNLIDESVEILQLMSQTNDKYIYRWGFKDVFDYLLKNNKQRLRNVVKTLNKNITFKTIKSMIKFNFKIMSDSSFTEFELEAEKIAELIKLLPPITSNKYKKLLINFIKQLNLVDLANKLEAIISSKETTCVICRH